MRSLLVARSTADWMWRKRQRSNWRRRIRRLRAYCLPLKAFRIRFAESCLQTISGLALCPPWRAPGALRRWR